MDNGKIYRYKAGSKVFLTMTVYGGTMYGIALDRLVKNAINGQLKNKIMLNPYRTMSVIDGSIETFRSMISGKGKDISGFDVKTEYNFPGVNIDQNKVKKMAHDMSELTLKDTEDVQAKLEKELNK